MKTETKIQYGAIGLLALIVAAMGGSMYLTEDQLDSAYICSINQEIIIAEYLSSTAKTAYWTEDNVTKSKTCRNGLWMNLKQYAKDNNLELNILLQNLNSEELDSTPQLIPNPAYGIQYRCDSIKCERIR